MFFPPFVDKILSPDAKSKFSKYAGGFEKGIIFKRTSEKYDLILIKIRKAGLLDLYPFCNNKKNICFKISDQCVFLHQSDKNFPL